MSLSTAELKRKMSLGDADAAKVYTIRRQGNLLLTTLLIGNVAVNAALSIYLGSIASGLIAALVATILIVIFGEILPQAVFSRHALIFGAKLAWLVQIIIFLLYPIAMPIAWTLNKLLGKELATIYSKKELIKIIEEHEEAQESDLDSDEERIIKGALTFSDKRVTSVMTPLDVVLMFEATQKIDTDFLRHLGNSSHTRIPIFSTTKNNIIGILYIKQLLNEHNIGKTVGEVAHKKVLSIHDQERLDTAFRSFLQTRYHLYIVKNSNDQVEGIITLEDIVEEIIKSEIVDETDRHPDLRKISKKKNEATR